MFVILVYDVASKRDAKVLKLCRRYLTWVQNSVFEGEITEAKFKMLQKELKGLIKDQDSIIVYQFRSKKYWKRMVLGEEKGEQSYVL